VPESWAAGVSKHSKAKDAAFDFLGFFANPANHKADMLVGRRGINSFRVSCGEKSFWLDSAGWDEETTASYLRMWESYRKEPNHAYPLRIIESRRYLVALSEGIHKALAGSLSPQKALDAVARKWTELNERVGINRQRSAYAQTVALEDGEIAR
jgi:ABC-type glycerol-3-phosphate transport system substrate-binding protein